MNIKKKFGIRVKQLRIEKKLSQEALAIDANVDRGYLSNLENGKGNISIENIEKILDALGVTFNEFFSEKIF
jgi:transcriptional regulator with XRE-family HTH domain